MRFLKHSIDYQINLEAFHEMEDCVPMTNKERSALRSWAKQGYDIETNPWEFTDSDGWPLNYLRAYRLYNGYSSGPWDEWRGPEDEMMWDIATKSIIPKENFD